MGEGCMRALAIFLAVMISACATELQRVPTSFTVASDSSRSLQMSAPVSVTASAGYTRTLPAGSKWSLVGSIPEGDIFKIENSVFTIEARHVHEAYLVVQNLNLVGFYLPVEQAFSPLSPKILLPIK